MDISQRQLIEIYLRSRNLDEIDRESSFRYIDNLSKRNLPIIFNGYHFSRLVGIDYRKLYGMISDISRYYHWIYIPKKNGEKRRLDIPSLELKRIQRWILDNILNKCIVSEYATGFKNNSSILNNASKHLNKDCIINLDIKDFFPSINQDRVFRIFYYYGYTTDVAYLLARICTFENRIPQGAPTSPYISNISCIKLDKRISKLAQKYDASYSRYADDITISGKQNIVKTLPLIKNIIRDEQFEVNDNKTRVLYRNQRQEVTGLIVNGNKVTIEKEYLKKIKQEIYYCKKYGVDNHLSHINSSKRFYKDHMYGKAYFVQMIDKEKGKKLLKELDEIEWEWDSNYIGTYDGYK